MRQKGRVRSASLGENWAGEVVALGGFRQHNQGERCVVGGRRRAWRAAWTRTERYGAGGGPGRIRRCFQRPALLTSATLALEGTQSELRFETLDAHLLRYAAEAEGSQSLTAVGELQDQDVVGFWF